MSDPPPFSARKLMLWVTGSVNAAMVPYWLNWLRQFYPEVKTSIFVTAMAERFVTVEALEQMVHGRVWRDAWDDDRLPVAPHVEIEEENDCFGVFPATLNSAMALASGATRSPALMVLQATSKPVVIAPTFPARNEVIDAHLDLLTRRSNVELSEEMPAFSVGKQQWSGSSGFFMPLVIQALESGIQRGRQSAPPVPAADEPPDRSGEETGPERNRADTAARERGGRHCAGEESHEYCVGLPCQYHQS